MQNLKERSFSEHGYADNSSIAEHVDNINDIASSGMYEMLHQTGALAVGVVHEAKNPLQSISALASVMRSRYKDFPEIVEYSSLVIDQVNDVSSLLSGLLGFVNFQYHNKEQVDINDICSNVVKVLRSSSRLRNIFIMEEYSEDIPSFVSNAACLRQILINLLMNSIDAAENGGNVRLKTIYDIVQNCVHIVIVDNGCGMDEKTLEKCTAPFYTTKKGGTGLGMPLCCLMTEKLGGTIKINSRLGFGTVIKITLPLQ